MRTRSETIAQCILQRTMAKSEKTAWNMFESWQVADSRLMVINIKRLGTEGRKMHQSAKIFITFGLLSPTFQTIA